MSIVSSSTLDAILEGVVQSRPGVPGVAAVATDPGGDLYRGAAGVRSLITAEPFTTDTVCRLFSATKALTTTTCLQLLDEGVLDLDAPTREYLPEIGELQVLESFGPGGELVVRPPTRDITTRMLLLHTAGFGCDTFNEISRRLYTEHAEEFPSTLSAVRASLTTPLLFDPGERWEYGTSTDWVGLVVEAITGRPLGDVMTDRIFDPLEMTSTTFEPGDDLRARLASMHRRRPDGSVEAIDFDLPSEPELHMGGHGLYSTAEDYARFIRMWLNDGMAPDGPVLRPETVELAAADGLDGAGIRALPSAIPSLTNDVEFFPGMPKSWGLGFMINEHDAPTGRPAGSLAWAGLANLYYWIDRRSRIGGFWATQLLPFFDATAVGDFLAFETAVYDGMS
jgi:methyl acetate hydrolase